MGYSPHLNHRQRLWNSSKKTFPKKKLHLIRANWYCTRARRLVCKALRTDHYLNEAAKRYLGGSGMSDEIIEAFEIAIKGGVSGWLKAYKRILENLQLPLPDTPGLMEKLRTSNIDLADLPVAGSHTNSMLAVIVTFLEEGGRLPLEFVGCTIPVGDFSILISTTEL